MKKWDRRKHLDTGKAQRNSQTTVLKKGNPKLPYLSLSQGVIHPGGGPECAGNIQKEKLEKIDPKLPKSRVVAWKEHN